MENKIGDKSQFIKYLYENTNFEKGEILEILKTAIKSLEIEKYNSQETEFIIKLIQFNKDIDSAVFVLDRFLNIISSKIDFQEEFLLKVLLDTIIKETNIFNSEYLLNILKDARIKYIFNELEYKTLLLIFKRILMSTKEKGNLDILNLEKISYDISRIFNNKTTKHFSQMIQRKKLEKDQDRLHKNNSQSHSSYPTDRNGRRLNPDGCGFLGDNSNRRGGCGFD